MVDYFSFFPESDKGVVFIDTCAFDLRTDEKRARGTLRDLLDVGDLKDGAIRLRFLKKKLSGMENWTTIEEVIREFRQRDDRYANLQKTIQEAYRKFNPLISAIGELLDAREKIYILLKEEHRNATINLDAEQIKKRDSLLIPKINRVFKRNRGKTNEMNTDCKLIATALIYAEDLPVYMFSNDKPILRTFTYCAVKMQLNIKGTFILDEKGGKIISTPQYWLEHPRN